jgi:hypothetical protein
MERWFCLSAYGKELGFDESCKAKRDIDKIRKTYKSEAAAPTKFNILLQYHLSHWCGNLVLALSAT